MIRIDSRVGSKDLMPFFPKGEAQLCTLQFGDACFIGEVNGEPVHVGFERKNIGDFLNSMSTGRLAAHQLPGLAQSYDIYYLILEGVWRMGQQGELQLYKKTKKSAKPYWFNMRVGGRGYMCRELDGFINSLQLLGGMYVRETRNERHTAMLIRYLYHWYQKDKHTSHLAMRKNRFRGDGVQLAKPSLGRRIAAELPGIGWTRSSTVASYFRSVDEMVSATEATWLKIPGIGKGIAKKVWEALRKKC